MSKFTVAILALPALLAVTACVTKLPGQQPLRWSGALNVRGGAAHEGSYSMSLTSSPEIEGIYLHNSKGCLEKGEVRGVRRGGEVRMTIADGISEMEIKAALDGGVLYGRYEFTRGPCKGDWGSTTATPSP